MTAAERILDKLEAYYPEALSDNQLALFLGLPEPSVRRTRRELEMQGTIEMLDHSYNPYFWLLSKEEAIFRGVTSMVKDGVVVNA